MHDIYNFLDHLLKCPEVFFQIHPYDVDEPQTFILIKDLMRKRNNNFSMKDSEFPSFDEISNFDENHLISMQIGCWFFSYYLLPNSPRLVYDIHEFLFYDLKEISKYVKAMEWVEDEDRAEEFIRLALKSCNILPLGETTEEAADRLDALDTLKRLSVIRETNQALERAREIRRKMAEEKAKEAANMYGRE